MVNFLIFGFFQTVILCVYHSVAGAQRIDVFLRLLSHPALQNWLSLVPEILCCLSEKMCRGIKEIANANHCLPIHMATHKHVYAPITHIHKSQRSGTILPEFYPGKQIFSSFNLSLTGDWCIRWLCFILPL